MTIHTCWILFFLGCCSIERIAAVKSKSDRRIILDSVEISSSGHQLGSSHVHQFGAASLADTNDTSQELAVQGRLVGRLTSTSVQNSKQVADDLYVRKSGAISTADFLHVMKSASLVTKLPFSSVWKPEDLHALKINASVADEPHVSHQAFTSVWKPGKLNAQIINSAVADEPRFTDQVYAADLFSWIRDFFTSFTSEQHAETIEAVFQNNKVSNQGQVGINLKAFSHILGVIAPKPIKDEQVKNLFDMADRNNNGLLDRHEFLSMFGEQQDMISQPRIDGALARLVSVGWDVNSKYYERLEDRWTVVDPFPFLPSSVEQWAFFAVFDGHGGPQASEQCHKRLPELLAKQLAGLEQTGNLQDDNIKDAFMKVFEQLDKELKGIGAISFGTTATVALIRRKNALSPARLYVANVGDSAVLYINRLGQFFKASKDHRPSDPDEARRVEALGGKVTDGRVARVNGILAVSRAFGDHQLKGESSSGLSSEPSFATYDADDLAALVIASDGLWDYLTDEPLIAEWVKEDQTRGVAQRLVRQALESGSKDNICCLVVYYNSFTRTGTEPRTPRFGDPSLLSFGLPSVS